ATLRIKIRAGGVGEDGMLTRASTGAEMLDVEFTVVDGEFKQRRFWMNLVLQGHTDGHAKAAEISRGVLRTIIESALGIKPDDMSPQAREDRILGIKAFDGMTFIGKIGIEKGGAKPDGSGNYSDKNFLSTVITPDRKEWHAVVQPPPCNDGGSSGSNTAS